jgi:hypothetical protein
VWRPPTRLARGDTRGINAVEDVARLAGRGAQKWSIKAVPLVSPHGTIQYLMRGTRSRGPARCLNLEAWNFLLGDWFRAPPGRIRVPSRLVSLTPPTYVYAVLHSVVCPFPPLQTPTETPDVPAIPVPRVFREKGKGERKKNVPCAGEEDRTRTLPCRVSPIAMHRARLRVGRDTAVYLHSRSKTGKRRWWVQVEYQDNYVKCNAGY